jgi:hypothetical protein
MILRGYAVLLITTYQDNIASDQPFLPMRRVKNNLKFLPSCVLKYVDVFQSGIHYTSS